MLIKFVEIDLTKPVQPVYVDARYGRLFALVTWGYQPLGLLHLHRQHNTHIFTSEQLKNEILRSFGWQLWQLTVAGIPPTLSSRLDSELPPISVIVCTRDRAESLKRCLQALKQLDYPNYEVVVVDNCSRDPRVAEVIHQSGFRYIREERPGLDWARNRGIAEAQHDIVAYVDDDALAAPGWLRGIARGFEDSEIMAVTGMVVPAEIETRAQDDFEIYGGMSKGFSAFVVRREELTGPARFWSSNWGVGANMAFRREVFDEIGYFDIGLDVGTATCGGGDIEFFYRLVTAGNALRYEPAAFVRHIHRRDQASLTRQIYNNGRSFGCYLLTIARNKPELRAAVLWFALRWWIYPWLLRRLLVGLRTGDRRTVRFAIDELKGSLSALGAYRTARAVAQQQLRSTATTARPRLNTAGRPRAAQQGNVEVYTASPAQRAQT
jgi:glycosyltransferase involved in cell wall biosynthesis